MSDLERIPVEEEIREELKTSKTEFTQETLEKLAALLKLLDEKCPPQPHLRLKPFRVQSTSVFDSKLGGIPYFPKDMEYPKVLEGRQNMAFFLCFSIKYQSRSKRVFLVSFLLNLW